MSEDAIKLLNHGKASLTQGMHQSAIDSLSASIRLSASVAAYMARANAYMMEKVYSKAEGDYSDALFLQEKESPENEDLLFEILTARSQLKLNLNRREEALEDLDLLHSKLQDADLRVEIRQLRAKITGTTVEDPDHERLVFVSTYRKHMAVHLNDTWFVISMKWFQKWQRYVNFVEQHDLPFEDPVYSTTDKSKPSMINNTNIIDFEMSKQFLPIPETSPLKLLDDMTENKDFIIVPEACYLYLKGIYGSSHDIERQAFEVNDTMYKIETQLEVIQIAIGGSSIDVEKFQASGRASISWLKSKYLAFKGIDKQSRIWKLSLSKTSLDKLQAISTSNESVYLDGGAILDESGLLRSIGLRSDDLLLVEIPQNGSFLYSDRVDTSVEKCGYCQKPNTALSCKSCLSVRYCSAQCKKRHYPEHKQDCVRPSSSRKVLCFCRNCFPSTSVEDTVVVIPHIQVTEKSKMGLVGLKNLGNTCFISAALHCLSNTEALTQYFLSKDFERDLNTTNPLGTNGRITAAYCGVIENLWSGSAKAYSPIDFKKVLGKIAPQFAGYQQHDTHEFLCFLLDALNEDLNRNTTKTRVDDDESANQQWEKHLANNNSVIAELMHGQFKSTIYCPNCKHYSFSFDPFSSLSLPLPVQEELTQLVYFIYKDPNTIPACVVSKVPPASTLKAIRSLLETEMKTPNFTFVGVCNNSVREFYEDEKAISSIHNATIFAYETAPSSKEAAVEIQIFRGSPIGRPVAYPRLVFVNSNDTFQDLHIEVFRVLRKHFKHTEKSNIDKEYALFMENPHYTLKLSASRVRPCQFCKDSACKGCYVPFSHNSLDIILGENHVVLECVFKADVTLIEANKCSELVPSSVANAKNQQKISLYECFKNFQVPEELDADNKWHCKNCKTNVQAVKKLEIYRLPHVLVLHLKRFKNVMYIREKISAPVTFPEDDLNVAEFVIGPDKPTEYELFGVVNHFGSMGGGHYTATCKNFYHKKWIDYNDIVLKDATAFNPAAAYLLFYKEKTLR